MLRVKHGPGRRVGGTAPQSERELEKSYAPVVHPRSDDTERAGDELRRADRDFQAAPLRGAFDGAGDSDR